MSNIFNLLGGIVESDKDQVIKSMARSKTSHEIRLTPVKTMGGTKLKGLSIRSKSDMNVSQSIHPATVKKDTYGNKEKNFLKPRITQVDNSGCPISPGKETKKLLVSSTFKESVSKEETTTKKMQKTLNDGVFKKPMPLKKNIKKFPEPEKLASWYDNEHEFDYGYIDDIEKEFKDLLSKTKENIKPRQEKTLISETSNFVEIPKLIFDRSIDEEYNKFLSSDLPEISDISDDDYL